MPEPDITALLRRVSTGDDTARGALVSCVYDELRRLARLALRDERKGHTLEPTALVHEAYLRLLGGASVDWVDRCHFFHTASRTMRRILRDYARSANAAKRSGGVRIQLDEPLALTDERAKSYLALDQALDRLEELDPCLSQVVELKYFIGLEIDDIAVMMGKGSRTVKRDWQMARAWLHGQLSS
jgi:RNA polymerase sigma factor (TIGR02999 family)